MKRDLRRCGTLVNSLTKYRRKQSLNQKHDCSVSPVTVIYQAACCLTRVQIWYMDLQDIRNGQSVPHDDRCLRHAYPAFVNTCNFKRNLMSRKRLKISRVGGSRIQQLKKKHCTSLACISQRLNFFCRKLSIFLKLLSRYI